MRGMMGGSSKGSRRLSYSDDSSDDDYSDDGGASKGGSTKGGMMGDIMGRMSGSSTTMIPNFDWAFDPRALSLRRCLGSRLVSVAANPAWSGSGFFLKACGTPMQP
jgi:hypothetical protein